MSTPAIVQHKSEILTVGVPGSKTLASTPTVGNLLLVFMHVNLTTTSITVNTSKWTNAQSVIGGTGNTSTYGQLLYRYVQAGDTTAMPAFWTAGSTYWAYQVYEISGVTGTFATDVPLIAVLGSGTASNVLSLQPAALTSTVANALAIFGAGHYNGSHNPTIDNSYAADETGNNAANYGSQCSGSKAIASSGTSNGQPTVSFTSAGSGPCDAISVIVQPPGATTETATVALGFGPIAFTSVETRKETATVAMGFGPVAFSAADARKETPTVAMQFGPLSFSSTEVPTHSGAVTMRFGPLALSVNALDVPGAGRGLRQFWTR